MQHRSVFHPSDRVEIHFPVCQSFKSILIAYLPPWFGVFTWLFLWRSRVLLRLRVRQTGKVGLFGVI